MIDEKQFWSWFSENKYKYVDHTHEKIEDYLDELLEQLHFYNERLFFEIGGPKDSEEKEIIITALGEKENFSSVYRLVDSAPPIEKWRIIALKPPITLEDRCFKSNYYGIELDTSKIFFDPLESRVNPELIGLRVLINDIDESKHGLYFEGILMIIHTILGERMASENISYVEVVKNANDSDPIPIIDLPEFVEWKKSKAKN